MIKMKLTISLVIIIGILSCTDGNNKILRSPIVLDEVSNFDANETSKSVNEITERKVIKRGEIRFQTKSIQETTNFFTQNVKDLKGYISSENVYNTDDRITQRIEIRIPSNNFDDLLLRISENVKKIDYKNVQLQDVTEEYIDVETRIRTKKDLENRYRELLLKAKTVEEILSIEKELGALRSDIESIEGRLKYLEDQVSFSTLSVEYYELISSTMNFSSKLGHAIVIGWKYLLGFFIGLVQLWPFIIIIVIVIIITIGLNKKKKQKNTS